VHLTLLDTPLVAELLRSVEVVMSWPINDPATLDRALDIGVNGIISDEPDVLADLLSRRA
jgi:glycerophosphoryl diester phosphodiesterase